MPETTDPKQLPGADPHTGNRLIDPVSGYDTTGHDWGGITELNTAFPKIVIWALVLSFGYSVIAWILLPAWPYGGDYTRGLLKRDQQVQAAEGFRDLEAGRQDWMTRFASEDPAELQADAALMQTALPAARRLFDDNCAACHGAGGTGGPGFPVLADETWLWSSAPETLVEILRYGINSDHPDTFYGEMPAFDWMERSERAALSTFVVALQDGSADFDSDAGALFTENCASCHGDDGAGGLEVGAPALTDAAVIYGQDHATVMETLRHGRAGVMPSWEGRLSDAEITLLALYVAQLSEAAQP